MPRRRRFSFGAIVLAAGASSRMGRPKLLLPWGQTTVLGHLIALWSKLGAGQIAVVRAAGDTTIGDELDRLGFPVENRIVNPEPRRGMFSSVQCAARWDGWKPKLSHWVIVLGDQPHLRPSTLQALLEAAASRPEKILQPSRLGRPRHPVLFPEAVFSQLGSAPVDSLRQFLQSRAAQIERVDLDDAGLDLDIDEPRDYEIARRLFG